MSENKKKKKKNTQDVKFALVINAANKYKKDHPENQFPERRKIAEMTGLSLGNVQQIIRDIKKQSGKLYARDLTDTERGKRSKQSREGKEYELI